MSPQKNNANRPARVPRAALGIIWLTAALATAACVDTATSTCADGLRCPAGKVCLNSDGAPPRCEPAAQVSGCMGRAEGDSCLHSSNDPARCRAGLCTPMKCGNGHLDDGEACDDGNVVKGDGCSSDCLRQCGNENVEEEQDEICDSAPPPGQHCVDLGFDMGTLTCARSCQEVNTQSCIDFDWQPMPALPPDWQIARVWVFSPDNAVAVGGQDLLPLAFDLDVCLDCGRIFRYDGNEWTEEITGKPLLLDLWASGPDDIYAVGVFGTILHFDGSEWSPMKLSDDYHPIAIWGTGPDDLFAVGAYWRPNPFDLSPDTATIMALRYDGRTWTPMDIPEIMPRPEESILSGVWGSGPDDVFAVGPQGIVLHYDGNAQERWTHMDGAPDNNERLIDVWGTGADDVLAVGEGGTILRYDGAQWSSMQTPTNQALLGIWGDDLDQRFAVGFNGTLLRLDSPDAEEWIPLSSGTSSHLVHVHGSGADNVLAVGTNGTVLRSGGTGWAAMDMQGNRMIVNDIWGSDIDCVYAVTTGGTIWHYDGNPQLRWQPMAADAQSTLRGVHGLGCGKDLYAVGVRGAILRFVDGAWARMQSSTSADLQTAWVAGPNAVFVVGDDGTILRYDGNPEGRWEPMTSGVDVNLKAVWGASPSNVFTVGAGGTLLYYDGNTEGRWTPMDSYTQSELHDVWGWAPEDVVAVGEGGYVINYDGETWTHNDKIPSVGRFLKTVWGSRASDVFIGSHDGMLLHYDGTHWSPMRSPTEHSIDTFWGNPDGTQLLVGDEAGRIFRLVLPRP